MARAAKPMPKSLAALTGGTARVPLAVRDVPEEIKQFIFNAIDESEVHSDYLRIPENGDAPSDVIDAGVKHGRAFAKAEGFKLLTRDYKPGESTHLVYRVKPYEADDEDGETSE